MILLVVDTQKGCFNESLYSFETVKNNIKLLIDIARENHIEVVYVQHDDGLLPERVKDVLKRMLTVRFIQ